MKSEFSRDPLSCLRQTIAAIDKESQPLTPELVYLRQLLEKRIRLLEAQEQRTVSGLLSGNASR